jgi:hypothetical protein
MQVESVRNAVDSLADSRGRPLRHVAAGLARPAGRYSAASRVRPILGVSSPAA